MNGAEMTIVGNLVRFDLRFGANGNAWGTGAIAATEFTTSKSGERTEQTTFVDFKVFGSLAEHLAESADKGTRLVIIGKLRNEKWTAQDGTERRSMTLYVDEVAASLRWATAAITKVSGNGGGAPRSSAPAASSAPMMDEGFGGSDLDDNPFR